MIDLPVLHRMRGVLLSRERVQDQKSSIFLESIATRCDAVEYFRRRRTYAFLDQNGSRNGAEKLTAVER